MSDDPLKPSISLLCKVGSIVTHAEEALSRDGHAFDLAALKSQLDDIEVQRWLGAMGARAFIPLKRTADKQS